MYKSIKVLLIITILFCFYDLGKQYYSYINNAEIQLHYIIYKSILLLLTTTLLLKFEIIIKKINDHNQKINSKCIIILIFIGQMNNIAAQASPQAFIVSKEKNTYISLVGIEKPQVDLGNNSVIAEITSLTSKNHIIKLKAKKEFKITTIMITGDNGDPTFDYPVYEVIYNPNSIATKYALDFTYKEQSTKTVTENVTTKIQPEKQIQSKTNEEIKDSLILIKQKKLIESAPYKFIKGVKTNSFRIELIKLFQSRDTNIYFCLRVQNYSGQDYVIDDINIIIEKTGTTKRNNSILMDKKIIQQTKNITINSNQEHDIYFLTKHFILSENEKLILQIQEKTELTLGRFIELDIPYKYFQKITSY